MTRGALIFAYNNSATDYVAMAAWSVDNIHRHLGIPVCVVTDQESKILNNADHVVVKEKTSSGSRFFSDVGQTVEWHNTDRMDAFNITPWSETLMLDADYVVASDVLNKLQGQEFVCHDRAWDITGLNSFETLNSFGRTQMPMLWATVVNFQKTRATEMIFNGMDMIKHNWRHYCDIYGISRSTYRNDFSLTIAYDLVNGHCLQRSVIPWGLASLVPDHALTRLEQDRYRINFRDSESRSRWITLQGQDFHAMGKQHLGDIVADHA